jgi:Protein of unknown function (DUF4256)
MGATKAREVKINRKDLSSEQRKELLRTLRVRFEENMNRHSGLEWAKIEAKLEANAEKLWSLNEMERTGGEPDVVGHDKKTGVYIFYDCSTESPKAAEVFATTVKHWSQGKNTSQKITLSIWQPPWVLSF